MIGVGREHTAPTPTKKGEKINWGGGKCSRTNLDQIWKQLTDFIAKISLSIEGKGTFENVDIRMDDGGERRAGGESHEQ
jgi:hypothetical protein